jgi:hypothetical protein
MRSIGARSGQGATELSALKYVLETQDGIMAGSTASPAPVAFGSHFWLIRLQCVVFTLLTTCLPG